MRKPKDSLFNSNVNPIQMGGGGGGGQKVPMLIDVNPL